MHFNRAAAGYGGVAWLDGHEPPRYRRFGCRPRHKQESGSVAQCCRTQHKQQRAHNTKSAKPLAGAHHARSLERRTHLQGLDGGGRPIHQPRGERWGHSVGFGTMRFLHGGHQGLTQLRRVFLDVQRKAIIASASQERNEQSAHYRCNDERIAGQPRERQHACVVGVVSAEQSEHRDGREDGDDD